MLSDVKLNLIEQLQFIFQRWNKHGTEAATGEHLSFGLKDLRQNLISK